MHISSTLCGGIDVAIPTAIPDDPFARRLGKFAGKTIGSLSTSSYVNLKSTHSSSIPDNNNSEIVVNLDSV